MIIQTHQINSLLQADLNTTFSKLYTIDYLWNFAKIFYSILNFTLPEKRPLKEIIVEFLLDCIDSEDVLRRFYNSLPETHKSIIFSLCWDGRMDLEFAEKKYGVNIVKLVTERKYGRTEESIVLNPAFSWIVVDTTTRPYYAIRDPLKSVTICLPSGMISELRKILPKPKSYYLNPVEKFEGKYTFKCDNFATSDLKNIANYSINGLAEFTQSGSLKKSTLQAVKRIIAGGEFYETKGLEFLRAEILTQFTTHALTRKVKKIVSPKFATTVWKEVFDELLLESPEQLAQQILPYIKNAYGSNSSLPELLNIKKVLRELSGKNWVSFKNLMGYIFYREIDIVFLRQSYSYCTVTSVRTSFDQQERIDLNSENSWLFLQEPSIAGICFMLAAFGFMELKYNEPVNHRYRRAGKNYLTPFDGLTEIRLTPLGEYALGLVEDFSYENEQEASAELLLNEEKLTISCKNIEPITELTLCGFAEKVAPSFYRVTRQTIIQGCRNVADVENRILQFKKSICANPPQNWEDFFEEVVESVEALSACDDLVVYKLNNTPEIKQLFVSDPVLKKLIKKAEDFCVIFRQKDRATIARRLSELGYLISD